MHMSYFHGEILTVQIKLFFFSFRLLKCIENLELTIQVCVVGLN